MRCHYVQDDIAGKVLIPGCIGTAVANDIDACTCGNYHGCKSDRELISYLREQNKFLKDEIRILKAGNKNES